MQDNTVYNESISEKMLLEAITKQLDRNNKISFQFNKFLYDELKEDTLDMSKKTGVVQKCDNGKTR